MRVKGYTVHADNGLNRGYGLCGTKARGFLNNSGLSKDPRYVSCRKCEKLMAVQAREAAK